MPPDDPQGTPAPKSEGSEATPKPEQQAKQPAEKTPSVTSEQLVSAIRYLVQQHKDLAEKVEGLQSTPPPASTPQQAPPGEADLEGMTRSEFANHLMGEMQEKLLKPLQETITQKEATQQQDNIRQQVKDAEQAYPDFWEWQDEVRDVLKAMPGLSVDDAYTLARKRNPDKAKRIDTAKPQPEPEKESRKESPDQIFGGLLPTSGRGGGNEKMKFSEASTDAWEKEMTGFDHLLSR